MSNVTELPPSDDNLPVFRLIKEVTDSCYVFTEEMSVIEIIGVLEAVKHQLLFDDALEQVEWEE